MGTTEVKKSVLALQFEIEWNFKNMSEEEMRKALSNLCEAVKAEMIEKVESALYFMKNKQY